jgi:hypothetical protein
MDHRRMDNTQWLEMTDHRVMDEGAVHPDAD